MMDEVDRKLLALLQADATLAMAQLADQVGLSPTPVWKRVQKLEAAGVITRRVALVAPERVGVGLIVFVAIEAPEHSPEWMAGFARAVAGLPEVMDAYRMAGEIDYMLRVAIEAPEHSPEWMAGFARAVAGLPEVMDAYRMAGEIDYMLRVAVPDMAEFDAFYKRLVAAVPLKNVTSRFSMETLKHTTAYPLPARAFRDRRGDAED